MKSFASAAFILDILGPMWNIPKLTLQHKIIANDGYIRWPPTFFAPLVIPCILPAAAYSCYCLTSFCVLLLIFSYQRFLKKIVYNTSIWESPNIFLLAQTLNKQHIIVGKL